MRDLLRRRLGQPLLALLRQGVTPDKLALSVALGTAIALVPVLGVSTALCAAAALALRLNMPAIQFVNYLLTPVQLLLIIPQLRFGEWLVRAPRFPLSLEQGLALLSRGALPAVAVLGTALAHATLAWLVLAPPGAFALYRALLPFFRRIAPAR
jgi:hypothetical protein